MGRWNQQDGLDLSFMQIGAHQQGASTFRGLMVHLEFEILSSNITSKGDITQVFKS